MIPNDYETLRSDDQYLYLLKSLTNQFDLYIRQPSRLAIAKAKRLLQVINKELKMVVERVPYTPPDPYEFLAQKRSRKLKEMRNLINRLNIAPIELGMNITKLV